MARPVSEWIGKRPESAAPMRTCEVAGCGNKFLAKGMCRKHYSRMCRNGNVDVKVNNGSPHRLDVLGKRFGLLTAIKELPKTDGMRTWLLRCDCGNERTAPQKSFCSGGKMRSCGCASPKRTPHGMSRLPEYRHWINMIERCEYPGMTGFEYYGGRGIKVCDRWRSDFRNFYADMGPRPSARHSVDRVDVNGNYEPGNCRWVLQRTQSRNTRRNRIVSVKGWHMPLVDAAENAPVPYNTVLYRLRRGWSVEDALSRPAKKGYRP